MDGRDLLCDDGQAMLALCSVLGLKEEGPAALTLSEWNDLEDRLGNSGISGPAQLIAWDADKMAAELKVTQGEAERIQQLLERSARVAMELENVFSRGVWATTRLDEAYPLRLRESLRQQAPTVIF